MSPGASHPSPARIAIFASGGGSNAARIMDHFAEHAHANVVLVVTNKPTAGVIMKAYQRSVPVLVLDKARINNPDLLVSQLQQFGVNFIALAGFLLLVPAFLVRAFPRRIVNIHPALLPKFGGKGMYGMHVHRAVKEAGETESGPTIHYVNEQYDDGAIIAQERVALDTEDTPEDIAAKVLAVEHRLYPRVIDELVSGLK
ncbi:MAG: phosphoribosylglycinamide formyltransferase [Saprospiraceae bacterium]|nr:phosphoribosylglycinamide formyltransferase [Saprospiraceae bacterium]